MKLIYAIVGNDDSAKVQHALVSAGYTVTKLTSTGGFMRVGNTTFMIGTEDEKVDEVMSIIRVYCSKRTYAVTDSPYDDMDSTLHVSDGGATVFVTDVIRYEKL